MPARTRNADSKIAAAITLLLQNQAVLLQTQAQFVAHLDEDRRRFTRIESELEQIKSLLLEHDQILKKHEQILKDLPEAIRQKIGFKAH